MNNYYPMRLADCFKILNVSPDENWMEVRKSYYSLAKRYHPDLNPGNNEFELRFKQVSQAFKTLEHHYRSLTPVGGERSFDTNSDEKREREPNRTTDQPLEPEFQVRAQYALFSSILNRLSENPQIRKLAFRLSAVWNDCERKIFMLNVEKDINIDSATASTGGTVRVRQGKENFEVPIPPGTWNRMSLRIPGRGEASFFNRKRGELILNIHVLPDEKVEESDFYYQVKIPRIRIQEGRVHTLDTFQGPIKYVLPRTVRNGQSFTLKAGATTENSLNTRHIVTVELI